MAVINVTKPQAAPEVDALTRQEIKDFNKAVKEQIAETETVGDIKEHNIDDSLATLVRGKYDNVKAQRNEIEELWLNDLRQYRGVYAPDVLQRMHPKRSKAYIRLTRTKVNTVDSRLSDFIFPANGDKNWSINPSLIATYSQEQREAIRAAFVEQTQQEASPEQMQIIINQSAKERSKKMSKTIEDQLSELRYREIMKEVLHSGNLYGTGILKGPMVSIRKSFNYDRNELQEWELYEQDDITPFIESVQLWDIFPDLTATKLEDCNFIIQRHKMSKHKLLNLAKRKDFKSNIIRQYNTQNPSGDFEDQYYDLELQQLGGVTTTTSANRDDSRKYEVLEYWGYMDAKDLEETDIVIPENKKGAVQLAVNIWVIGNKVIKACLSPIDGVKWPYYFYYYDKDETSIFGEGIAAIMRDVQELINASFRGMLDNAAISAGPQIEANLDLLPEDEDPTEVYPFKVWLRSGSGADASAQAVRVMDVGSKIGDFLRMNEAFEKYADEVTTIPRYMWGDNPGGGAGRTASGLSMMMGSANITIKDQVKNFDDGITKPFISAMYHWNMQFNDNDKIKGDFDVIARGSSSLIAKEVYANSLMQFANIAATPGYAPLIKHDNVLRSIVEVLDLDEKDLVKTDQEIAQEQQQAQESQQQLQQFMSSITESAREHGVSPKDMLDQGQALMMQKIKQQGAQQNGAQAQPAPAAR